MASAVRRNNKRQYGKLLSRRVQHPSACDEAAGKTGKTPLHPAQLTKPQAAGRYTM